MKVWSKYFRRERKSRGMTWQESFSHRDLLLPRKAKGTEANDPRGKNDDLRKDLCILSVSRLLLLHFLYGQRKTRRRRRTGTCFLTLIHLFSFLNASLFSCPFSLRHVLMTPVKDSSRGWRKGSCFNKQFSSRSTKHPSSEMFSTRISHSFTPLSLSFSFPLFSLDFLSIDSFHEFFPLLPTFIPKRTATINLTRGVKNIRHF